MSTYRRKSKTASTRTVKRFFANSPNSDFVSVDDIYAAAGRQDIDPEKNRSWLSNLATHLYYHGLVKGVYSYETGYKKLTGVELTLAGKRAIGRIESSDSPAETPAGTGSQQQAGKTGAGHNDVTMTDVAKVVKAFRDSNPEFEVVFDVKLKEVAAK